MRRISLAVALLSAVASAGCGAGAKPASDTGGAQGVVGESFTVLVQNGQGQSIGPDGIPVLGIKGGYVTSTPAGIDCGIAPHSACSADFPIGTVVTLTATAAGTDPAYNLPFQFFGWAGDCQGDGACTLTGNGDKYIVTMFGGKRSGHPNWSAGTVHGPKFNDFANGVAGAVACTDCHGSRLQGQGIALSCGTCHPSPVGSDGGIISFSGGHFDTASPAFDNHGTGWSRACQRCHTDQGFRDYVGALAAPGEATASDNHLDGTFLSTNPNTTNVTAPPTATQYAYGPLKCDTCHNPVTDPLLTSANFSTVRFVSSGRYPLLGATTNTTVIDNPLALPTSYVVKASAGTCVQCHQGRESTASVNGRISASPTPADLDAVISTGGFINPHYLGAAGTMFGTEAKMWAEYPSKMYTGRNTHGGLDSCVDCHDAHTGTVSVSAATCGKCHFDETTGQPVTSLLQLEESRQFGFEGDIDGDGIQQSLKHEIESLADNYVYAAIKAYATNVVGTSIVYDGAAYPYYFVDANGNGIHEATETTGFNQFTPRLLRAAFNYKWAHAEPGAWAHNPRYAIEILFDAVMDLNAGLTAKGKTTVPFAGFRSFNGHFGGARAASPYRAFVYSAFPATTGFGSAACYQCHGGKGGYEQYLSNPLGTALTTANKVTGMQCNTCHTYGSDMKGIRTDVTAVYFPPQKNPAATPNPGQISIAAANLPNGFVVCATCHSGRESGQSITNKIIGTGTAQAPQYTDATWTLSFTNPHYLGAAAVLLGTDAKMMYEFGGTYASRSTFGSSPHGASCTGCHQPKASKHTFEVNLTACNNCHGSMLSTKKAAVEAATDALYTALRSYATAAGKTVCYNDAANPYFFTDANNDGVCDATSATLNATALRAAFNLKWAHAEPGAYAHNYNYMMQAIYDSIVSLGGTPTFTRP